MATIKAYTDLEQSKKLAEILPLESADMVYEGYKNELTNEINYIMGLVSNWKSSYPDRNIFKDWNDTFIPCWSLAALIEVLPLIEGFKPVIDLDINQILYEGKYRDELNVNSENLIDACYEMIIRLHELKLL